ncbi:MAG TPA: penicillin-binding protein 2 [Acidimicrobiales bacterium]|nr:penicillin-binding protein 2 [Acidimicrobiales bacterium]
MNRQIRRVGVVLMGLFVALFLQLNYLQLFRADSLANDPRNTRAAVRDFSRPRGQIVAADGAVLARSIDADTQFERLREYPERDLFGHLTGYFSFTYGASGLERVYNDELAGRDLGIESLKDLVVDRTVTGDVFITASKGLQQVARDALGPRRGSVVALDPTTGAVLAMWSFPSFDPNVLSRHTQSDVQAAWNLLNAEPSNPLLGRAYQETFAPGSTFKVITSAAALERAPELVTKTYPVLRQLELPRTDRTLPNFGGGSCGGTLVDLLRVSCNTGFGQMGLDLGAEALVGEARDFGFDSRPPLDLTAVARAAIPDASDFERNEPALAYSAIGQQDVRATPLQMALVAGAVANSGVIMRPHLLAEVHDDEGDVVRRYEPDEWKTPVSPETATQLRELMINVVERGTGGRARVAGAVVGGKTGTAQTTGDNAHAWFVGFGEKADRRIAVAVIVESQPGVSEATGGRVAAPIAQAVMQAFFG